MKLMVGQYDLNGWVYLTFGNTIISTPTNNIFFVVHSRMILHAMCKLNFNIIITTQVTYIETINWRKMR